MDSDKYSFLNIQMMIDHHLCNQDEAKEIFEFYEMSKEEQIAFVHYEYEYKDYVENNATESADTSNGTGGRRRLQKRPKKEKR